MPQVAAVEVREREGRLTALPRDGELVLPAITELARAQRWNVNELHLESGRLDEVFRAITCAPVSAPARPAAPAANGG